MSETESDPGTGSDEPIDVEEEASVSAQEPSPPPSEAPIRSSSAPNRLPPPPGPRRTSGPGSAPPGRPASHPDAGRIVGGIVTEVSPDEVELVLEDGRLGVVHRRNWAGEAVADLTTVAAPGDRLEGAVLAREDPNDRVVLSRAWALEQRIWEDLEQAHREARVLELRVTGQSKNGLVVDVNGVRGFVPASHVDLDPVDDLSPFVGQTLQLKIIELDPSPRRRRLVLSRRSVLLREKRRRAHDRLTSLQVGTMVRGTVSSLSDYGAFVDLGGINGLVHVSELSWRKVRHPSEVVSVGEEIEVKVLEVKVKKRRIRLSLREAGDDPLAAVEEGTITSGVVTRLVDFGVFVEIMGAEGLVHLSELAEYRVSAPEELVTPGDEVLVKVLSVDRGRRRIELSIRQAVSDQFG